MKRAGLDMPDVKILSIVRIARQKWCRGPQQDSLAVATHPFQECVVAEHEFDAGHRLPNDDAAVLATIPLRVAAGPRCHKATVRRDDAAAAGLERLANGD